MKTCTNCGTQHEQQNCPLCGTVANESVQNSSVLEQAPVQAQEQAPVQAQEQAPMQAQEQAPMQYQEQAPMTSVNTQPTYDAQQQNPYGYQQQPQEQYANQPQQPYGSMQAPYATNPYMQYQQPKKKTGLVIGLSIGAFLLVIILFISLFSGSKDVLSGNKWEFRSSTDLVLDLKSNGKFVVGPEYEDLSFSGTYTVYIAKKAMNYVAYDAPREYSLNVTEQKELIEEYYDSTVDKYFAIELTLTSITYDGQKTSVRQAMQEGIITEDRMVFIGLIIDKNSVQMAPSDSAYYFDEARRVK